MLITTSKKPLCLIGYEQSTITQEGEHFISPYVKDKITVMTPGEFIAYTAKENYQYMVFFTLETELREKIISILDEHNLDCPIYIDKTAIVADPKQIGKGTFIGPFSTVMQGSIVGNHCGIEAYCLVSHYVEIGNNVALHSGTMVAGRTTIGNNCIFNFKSSALNALSICNGVEVGALSSVTKNIIKPGKYVGTVARYVGDITKHNV